MTFPFVTVINIAFGRLDIFADELNQNLRMLTWIIIVTKQSRQKNIVKLIKANNPTI